MGYGGLIVTDAMEMRAVASRYHPGESAVLALKAGIDVILLPPDVDLAIDAVVAAVKRGEMSRERIDRSVRKLLAMKQWVGVDRNRFVDVENVYHVVAAPEHAALAREIARKSITVLGNQTGLLPLSHADTSQVLDIVMADTPDPSVGRSFHGELVRRGLRVDHARLDPSSNQLTCDSILAKVVRSDKVILQLHCYTRSGQLTGFISGNECSFVAKVAAVGKPVVAISFGNPYLVMDFPPIEAYVCTYSSAEPSIAAAAEVLFGEEPASGKLPITIPGVYRFGDGVTYPKVALRSGTLEEAGFDGAAFAEVDRVMARAIRDSAFPGGVLLVARNGIIAHHKPYGAYTYEPYARRVERHTIYDLASVTKVIATTSAMMRLVSDGRVQLEEPVVKYLPRFGQNGKEKITLYNLLIHNSGLVGWRKFYEECGTPQCMLDSVFASPLTYRTGDTTIYSDLGLITVGKVIEKVSGVTLDRFVDSVFFRPLGMRSTMYNPPASLLPRIAPTEVDTFWRRTGRPVQGTVHDENCEVLGGVSGHAGLFSTASDLAVLLQMLAQGGAYGGKRFLKEDVVRKFTTRQSASSTRAIGWDTPNPDRSWAGTLISRSSFIHTGFTGTSVVVDPERNLIVVLLTNRVYPSRSSTKIFAVRPELHDAIVKALRP
jgi:CubicO group peptidase (beta-lactamase class C family)